MNLSLSGNERMRFHIKNTEKKKKNKCLNREQTCSNVQPFETFRNIMKRYRYKKKERETCTFKYLSQLKNLLN